jgi:hypothetical protein
MAKVVMGAEGIGVAKVRHVGPGNIENGGGGAGKRAHIAQAEKIKAANG